MLVEFVEPDGFDMKQRFLVRYRAALSVPNLASLSWYMLAHVPGVSPTTAALFPVGNRLTSAVSMRALFQTSSLQTVPTLGCFGWLPNSPVLFMYSPKNEPSPGAARTGEATSGRCETPDALTPLVM